MLLIKIIDVKSFMTKLLVQSVFDNFLLSEAEIMTCNLFQINGKVNEEWFNADEKEIIGTEEYMRWGELKSIIYEMIKGNKRPAFFKLVLMLNTENKKKLIHRVSGQSENEVSQFFLNMKYEKDEILITTGVGYTIFTMNRIWQNQWDSDLKKYLKYYEIAYEELT
ncbi:DUF5721 family protein [Anaeromicropila populeti]|uniref:Uncharacterized protein n=1 Tax=Anaeromicropila populeti TaxID=37658 RepID=A0A1I6JDL1_9FIRM|nr:DUF5721 family protein [Anaeromicropila populeti]SFR77103.1 hypothetical protein SAMN05661086_01596 [Anaeromicropila populeti]